MESLLEFESASARFLETPAAAVAAAAARQTSMIDRQIGPYTIVAPLGAGGMGEVYRARDSKLGRDVAIKILPSHFTADPERRARFAREARLLATLNHPHIGAIYGLEEADGVDGAGPRAGRRTDAGRSPGARTAADRRGARHRTPDRRGARGRARERDRPSRSEAGQHRAANRCECSGVPSHDVRAKVLDFGLAKPMALDAAAGPTQGPSGSFDGTADGRILGTPAYMSPEQARGQAVDKRTDIWAFGCVLYEMLRGAAPSTATRCPTRSSASWSASPTGTCCLARRRASIRRLLERCLRKDPRKRLHDIADAILDIDDATTMPSATAGADATASSGRVRSSLSTLPWLATIVLAAALAWVGWLYYRAAGALPTEPAQLTIHPPGGVGVSLFALSPDGRYLAFAPQLTSKPMVWVHSLVTGETRALPSTEGARGLFWKPDSQEIAYFAGDQLKTVALRGGSSIVVATVDPLMRRRHVGSKQCDHRDEAGRRAPEGQRNWRHAGSGNRADR